MQREIKFRAWDKECNRMVHDDIYPKLERGWDQWEQSLECMIHVIEQDHILMQFTGLLDKSGREIYEGDIITEGGVTGKVEYYRNRFMVFSKDKYIFSPSECCQVIGNIFESPDLLK